MSKPVQRLTLAAATALLSLAAHAVPDVYGAPGTEAPQSSFIASASGQLRAFYTGLAGSLPVVVGARINGVDGPTGLSNQSSAYGDSFVLGSVSANDSLVFFIEIADGSGQRFYSDASLNSDNINHAWAAAFVGDAQVPAGVNVAFEDLPAGGDFNYRDHSFVFQISAVPEPASWGLLLAGLGGIALRRRR